MDSREKAYRETVEQKLRQQSHPNLEAAVQETRHYFEVLGALDEGLLKQVSEDLQVELQERVRQVRDPYILSQSHAKWYEEEKHLGIHWPALATYLYETKGFPEEAVASISGSSREVVSRLGDPELKEFDVRGLVVGYVQSGKTANMTGVIARAVDAGYNFIIVLAGTTDKLRHQTQERLEGDLLARNPYNWQQLTKRNEYADDGALIESGDYKGETSRQLPNVAPGVTMVAVIKKHSALLGRLIGDIKKTSPPVRNRLRMLVIDDEADQASPNAGKLDEDPTITNLRIRELLDSLPAVSYVGYTATPFANVLINPFPENVKGEDENQLEDLYPRNFVISLPKPKGYFGAEQIFGRDPVDAEDEGGDGIDVIRKITKEEIDYLHPDAGKMNLQNVPSLRTAIRWFLLVVAARLARGQVNKHSSMLVHTSHKIDDHEDLHKPIAKEIDDLRANLASPGLKADLRALWDEEAAKVAASEFENESLSFVDLEDYLSEAAARITIAVENSKSDDRLSYGSDAEAVIAIGGNILARGLTLEGLAVTYFARNSKQYDTLLQMGRWFGYRDGYEDLVRLWMPEKVSDAFRQLALIEHELRLEIEEYAMRNARPVDFAVRIRTLPGLTVTGRNKMRHASVADIDYRGLHLQTIRFPRKDEQALKRNWQAASSIVSKAGFEEGALVGEVGVNAITEFFRDYSVHSSHRDLSSEWLEKYIRINSQVLSTWSVVIVQPTDSGKPLAEHSLGNVTPRLLNRSRLKDTDPDVADIKALMSRADIMSDVDRSLLPDSLDWKNWSAMKQEREKVLGGRPMLLLYPINRHSKPSPNGKKDSKRIDLDADYDVLGVGIVFPQLGVEADKKPTKYIQVDLRKGSFLMEDEEELSSDAT